MRLSSSDDPRLANYRSLKLGTHPEFLVVEGRPLVARLLASDFETVSIVTSPRHIATIRELDPPNHVSVFVLDSAEISTLVGFDFHRGCLACGLRKPNVTLDTVLKTFNGNATVVVCPSTTDPTNLGSILRNCHAFGVAAVLVGRQSADPFARRVIRVSMGASLKLPIIQTSDILRDMRRLRDTSGFELVGAVLDAHAELLAKTRRQARTAIVFGRESDGETIPWESVCSRRVTLPMQGEADSLNVASAVAVFLYHFTHVAPDLNSQGN